MIDCSSMGLGGSLCVAGHSQQVEADSDDANKCTEEANDCNGANTLKELPITHNMDCSDQSDMFLNTKTDSVFVPNFSNLNNGTIHPDTLESIVHKLDATYIGTGSPMCLNKNVNKEGDSLVERQWSPKSKPVENDQQLGQFHFKPLQVMSFNVLARSLVDNKYIANNRNVMSWHSRKYAILDVITAAKADVVCLQEIDQEEYEQFFLNEFKKLGYGSVYKKKKTPKSDGVCILYQEDRFDVIFHNSIEFPMHDIDYDRLQVAIIMALVDKHSRRESDTCSPVKDIYIVANTHLLFNKNRGDIKFSQLCAMLSAVSDAERLCLEYIGEEAEKQPKPAIIMCGDYNFTPQSLLYHFLSKGFAVIRNCNAKLISGQYLMHDWTYKTEQASHSKSGITVGNFERNYISEIYGTGNNEDWVEPLSKSPSIELFTKIPDWISSDIKLRESISNYVKRVTERGPEAYSPEVRASDAVEETSDDQQELTDSGLVYCPFKFGSAYSIYDPWLKCYNEPAFTAFHGWQRGCVDYIWYTKDELEVESIYELPPYGDVKAQGNLPNKGWPSSDHFSLISQLKRRSS
ncbi:Endonuclease/exonuclease/phosphatase like protein [Babesia gibsoni]|uniref:Endonuclease/exonuclease/phosphatase like protein n=1 Tax=Babesia gibsoni TaxID=33632 RepID=A0AAD8LIZ7_BABGI|nr:Endonuclease/exonuclease/phosphatase like protein [Babesia gibsoni]